MQIASFEPVASGANKITREQRNVFFALAQGRYLYGKDTQAVVKVFSKTALSD